MQFKETEELDLREAYEDHERRLNNRVQWAKVLRRVKNNVSKSSNAIFCSPYLNLRTFSNLF